MKEIKKIAISTLLCSMSIGCTHNRLSTREMLAMSNITSLSNSTMPIFVPLQLPTTPNNNMLQEPYQSLLKDMDDNMLLASPYGRQERSPNSRNKRDALELKMTKCFDDLLKKLENDNEDYVYKYAERTKELYGIRSIQRILFPEASKNPTVLEELGWGALDVNEVIEKLNHIAPNSCKDKDLLVDFCDNSIRYNGIFFDDKRLNQSSIDILKNRFDQCIDAKTCEESSISWIQDMIKNKLNRIFTHTQNLNPNAYMLDELIKKCPKERIEIVEIDEFIAILKELKKFKRKTDPSKGWENGELLQQEKKKIELVLTQIESILDMQKLYENMCNDSSNKDKMRELIFGNVMDNCKNTVYLNKKLLGTIQIDNNCKNFQDLRKDLLSNSTIGQNQACHRDISIKVFEIEASTSTPSTTLPPTTSTPTTLPPTTSTPTTSSADQAEKVENKTSLDEICKEHAANKRAAKEQSIIGKERTIGKEITIKSVCLGVGTGVGMGMTAVFNLMRMGFEKVYQSRRAR